MDHGCAEGVLVAVPPRPVCLRAPELQCLSVRKFEEPLCVWYSVPCTSYMGGDVYRDGLWHECAPSYGLLLNDFYGLLGF